MLRNLLHRCLICLTHFRCLSIMVPNYFTSGHSLMIEQLQFGKEQLWECNLIRRVELGDLLHLAVSEK